MHCYCNTYIWPPYSDSLNQYKYVSINQHLIYREFLVILRVTMWHNDSTKFLYLSCHTMQSFYDPQNYKWWRANYHREGLCAFFIELQFFLTWLKSTLMLMMTSSNGNIFRLSCYWPFVWGIHQSPANSSHKGQWRGALMFSLICIWI